MRQRSFRVTGCPKATVANMLAARSCSAALSAPSLSVTAKHLVPQNTTIESRPKGRLTSIGVSTQRDATREVRQDVPGTALPVRPAQHRVRLFSRRCASLDVQACQFRRPILRVRGALASSLGGHRCRTTRSATVPIGPALYRNLDRSPVPRAFPHYGL